MARVIGSEQDVESPYAWHNIEVQMILAEDGDTGTIDIPIKTLPAGTIVLDCKTQVLQAEGGATSSSLDIEVGSVTLLDAGVDNLGTVTFVSGPAAADVASTNVVLAAGDMVLNCEVTVVGTMVLAPKFLVSILCGRTRY